MLVDLLFSDLQEYLNLDEKQLRAGLDDSHEAVKRHWNKNAPQSDEEEVEFYKDTNTYLLELASWILDFPARRAWHDQITYFSHKLGLKTAIDFGCGIGSEALQLASDGLQVDLCEVSQASLNFALWRAKKHSLNINVIEDTNLKNYDLGILLDVIGHVTNPEELIVKLAYHCRYMFYTPDFQVPGGEWPMHREKPVNYDRLFNGVWTNLDGGFFESKLFRPKFKIVPTLREFAGGEGGVKRQVEALYKLLPEHGIDVVEEEHDFSHIHATGRDPKALVYTSHGYYPWLSRARDEVSMNYVMKQSIAVAKRVISVSDEAKDVIEEHLNKDVSVIRNGVFLEQLDSTPNETQLGRGYFLWAKNNVVGVCDPTLSLELARLMPNQSFVFTKVPSGISIPSNVLVIGSLPHEKMLQIIKGCSVYLGTTKEQFSVQTLEAMGMNKPVLCFPEGGNSKVVVHEKSGYIAQDLGDLVKGARYCLENAQRLGEYGRKIIEQEYTWQRIIPKIVSLYREAIDEYVTDLMRPIVSVVIPNYNLNEFLPQTIDSVLEQTVKNLEIIVVDDGSTKDISPIVSEYKDLGVHFILKKNEGVSASRNRGITESHGRYICCLDADDKIRPTFLEELIKILEADNRISLAYCDFELFGDAKGVVMMPEYNFEKLKEGNLIPCANVFRREAWEVTGGYKNINPSWEDYELWLNMGKIGFVGKHLTKPLFLYRKRGGQGRDFSSHGHEKRLRSIVNSYHTDLYRPRVSVVIPTYNHTHLLPETLDSLVYQTYRDFEVIIVDDGNKDGKAVEQACDKFREHFLVKIIHHEKNMGLASARNTGVRASIGDYILTLDSDDLIKPSFLEETVNVLEERPDIAIVYTDIEIFGPMGSKVNEMPDYDFDLLLEKNLMACASPYRREVFDKLGGYMTDMPWGWEDFDFWIRAGRIGYCAIRVPEPLFMYRKDGDSMILQSHPHISKMRAKLKEHSPDVFKGERPMGCCGKTRLSKKAVGLRGGFIGQAARAQAGEFPPIRMHYKGTGSTMIKGSVTGTIYQFGSLGNGLVDPRDVPQLLGRGDFDYAEIDPAFALP